MLVLGRALSREERAAVLDLGFDVGAAPGLVISPSVWEAASWRPDLPFAANVGRDGVPL